MAQLITVRLNKSEQQPLGFRLQGGKDFGTPLVVQKVNGGSAAERAGLQAGDALIRVNNTEVYALRHQEAQDTIRAAGTALELTVQRGGGTWRPSVTPTGSLPRPGSRPLGTSPTPVTNTSLKATPQASRAFGSGHNNVAKPFGYMNGTDSMKGIVNKQYNTPVNMYSDKTIAETLSAQTEVLAGGVLGVNFKKNEKTYDSEKSAVFKVLQEEQNDPEPEPPQTFYSRASVTRAGAPSARSLHSHSRTQSAPPPHPPKPQSRRVQSLSREGQSSDRLVPDAPHRPSIPVGCHQVLPDGRIALGVPAHPQPSNHLPVVSDTPFCSDCDSHIVGVFVRIKDKNLHVECFKCSTCGSSLKNQGYYNLNGKLYCDIHAKLVARQNPPAPNLEPVTVAPGGRIPTNPYTTPLPPLSTSNYTNGSSSLFSPGSNLSGPKPFGSSIGSAYSPSLSPRSAPMSPARPLVAPAHTPAPAAPLSAPFAPTNETQNTSSPHKMEFKSPAEERLIRKMAKMALNGYEIGIQRKIKPADHIQSMADRIQDTIVTKHPLNNSDNLTSGESSRDNTLTRPSKKVPERGFKHEISPVHNTLSAKFMNNGDDAPIPPPLPTTPIPIFSHHNSTIINDTVIKPTFNHSEKLQNGNGYLSAEESKQNKMENNSINTLKQKTGFNKSFESTPNYENNKNDTKLDNTFSNTMSKRKLFERSDAINDTFSSLDYNTINNANKISERNGSSNLITNKNNINKPLGNAENGKDFMKSLGGTDNTRILNNSLHDNSLYTYSKSPKNENIHNNVHETNGHDHLDSNNPKYSKNETEEVVVRRREKKNVKKDDGRRDSHIIARPLSKMTSADASDGQYICHVCDKAITRGPFITALGRIWCPEHFICVNATCRRPLQDIGFVEENGQLYCEFCFEQYIAPACDKCHAKIKEDCLNAIGKHFHPECFSCVYCGKLFGNNPFFLEDGLPYCEADWNELFTTKCFACGFPVEAGDRWVEALNNNYHSQCFNCTVCKKNLEGQSFFARGGKPFCRVHAR
ncbi:PDZ and LIM domain protein Zasp isoform X2 [Pieris rapae]|uniref:PDZ and LIM domain protein Zasp isoform X2 n=1 Tax=Pieris rapae TaxID=64459 RepID=UPI001E27E103|nr:PDZ and LIM domain protein Zasp isoform X2 [Pieris rapae]